jgi:pimeloyl-ACP methyl ester carboxylesterase
MSVMKTDTGVGRSTGKVPTAVAGTSTHALDVLDALCLTSCDVLGFSLGGMVAQQMVLKRPSIFHRTGTPKRS